MYLLIFLGLLGFARPIVGLDNTDSYYDAGVDDIDWRVLEAANSDMYDDIHPYGLASINADVVGDTKQRSDNRQKRAITTFMRRWKGLLKTTLGFRWVGDASRGGRYYYKLGTTADVVRDFYSLEPTKIIKIGSEIKLWS